MRPAGSVTIKGTGFSAPDVTVLFQVVHELLFQYIAFAPKLYVYGNKIVIKKWYGLRRKYYVKDIDKVIFEKSEGKIVTIQIISSISKDKYIDTVENFDKLLNYLLKNVEKEKMECYILGTKEEAEI